MTNRTDSRYNTHTVIPLEEATDKDGRRGVTLDFPKDITPEEIQDVLKRSGWLDRMKEVTGGAETNFEDIVREFAASIEAVYDIDPVTGQQVNNEDLEQNFANDLDFPDLFEVYKKARQALDHEKKAAASADT